MYSSEQDRRFPRCIVRFRYDVNTSLSFLLVVGVVTARRVEVAYETSKQRLVYLDLLASQHVTGKTVKCTFLYSISNFPTVVSYSVYYKERFVQVSLKSVVGKLGKTGDEVGNILTCNTLSVYVGDATLPDRVRTVQPGCQAGEERFNAMWFGFNADS